jgi:hypothetical protein
MSHRETIGNSPPKFTKHNSTIVFFVGNDGWFHQAKNTKDGVFWWPHWKKMAISQFSKGP